MVINLFLNFIIISKSIIIINRCQYLTVGVFPMAEMNDPNFLNYYVVGFFLTTGRKTTTQKDKVYFEPNRSSVIHTTNIY